MQEELCHRAGQELSPSPLMESWTVFCNEDNDSPLLGSKSVKTLRFCVIGTGIFVKCTHTLFTHIMSTVFFQMRLATDVSMSNYHWQAAVSDDCTF